MPETDTEYYKVQVVNQIEQAVDTPVADVAEVHIDLAEMYQALAKEEPLRPSLRVRILTRLRGLASTSRR